MVGLVLCAAGILLATFSVATIAQGRDQRAEPRECAQATPAAHSDGARLVNPYLAQQ